MALPPEVANGLYISGAAGLTQKLKNKNHSQITGNKVTRREVWGNCTYLPAGPGARRPGFQMTDSDPRNFLFVGNIVSGVAIGIVPSRPVNTHIYSDCYGGCEWHVLSRNDHSAAAFLHVYRGEGATVPYTLAGGWVYRGKVESAPVVEHIGVGNISSYAYVAGGANVAECCMLVLNNQGMVIDRREYQQIPI